MSSLLRHCTYSTSRAFGYGLSGLHRINKCFYTVSGIISIGENLRLSAIITKEEGEYVALCPELDVASQGESIEDALSNLKEAVELYLEDEKEIKLSEISPFVTTFEVKVRV